MSWKPIQIADLCFLGPDVAPASIEFKKGVNVICGSSDTGKSFVVEAVDFLLGSSGELRDIPERVGYDRGRLGLIFHDGKEFTIERGVEGGAISRYENLLGQSDTEEEGVTLSSTHRHGKSDTLSGWLLEAIELSERRIRRNNKGETNSLSFRKLTNLCIVSETDIIARKSPYLTGHRTSKTLEYATLKVLLTGVDDKALLEEKNSKDDQIRAAAQAEFYADAIFDLEAKIADLSGDEDDYRGQLQKIDETLEAERASLDTVQQDLQRLLSMRSTVTAELQANQGRITEIDELLSRFSLLKKHYKVDLLRLEAIQESGALFVHQESIDCPLCGTPPDKQHNNDSCDGDVEAVIHAATAEIDKIVRLTGELENTTADLVKERDSLLLLGKDLQEDFSGLDNKIRKTSAPSLGDQRNLYSQLVEKRSEFKTALQLFEQLSSLEEARDLLDEESAEAIAQTSSSTSISKSVLGNLSARVSELLKIWNFPADSQSYFDERTVDFVIGDKPRTSEGKGLRAITHAAASIALLEYCRSKKRPHPGFLILDSPLLAYWGPEGDEDSLIGTDLKERFYEYLVKEHQDVQIIIVENEHPPSEFLKDVNCIIFTQNPDEGRYGFFPRSNT